MSDIEFKSDSFQSFFALFSRFYADSSENYEEFIGAFTQTNVDVNNADMNTCVNGITKTAQAVLDSFPGIEDDKERMTAVFSHLKKIVEQVDSGKIKTIGEFAQYLSDHFEVGTNEINQSYTEYERFFNGTQECMEKNLEALKNFYNDSRIQPANLSTGGKMPETIGAYLRQMRSFFEVPEEKDESISLYLHPFPADPKLSGWAVGMNIHQTFVTKRIKKEEEKDSYFPNSTLLRRRMGTPVHEAAHWMFNNSPIMDKIKMDQHPAARQLKSAVQTYIDSNPDGNNRNAMAAIHEAFAASADSVVRPKEFDYQTDEMYYGFEAADRLARVFYPIFQEYIASGKKISEGFFERVIEDENFQKQFCQSSQKSLISILKSYAEKKHLTDMALKNDNSTTTVNQSTEPQSIVNSVCLKNKLSGRN